MKATLYWTPISHPCQAVRKMLDLKGIDYELVHVLELSQRVHLRIARFRRWGLKDLSIAGADLAARFSAPLVGYYAKTVEPDGRRGDETGVRADLAALPALLDRADDLVADGTLTTDPPNAASLQILSTVRTLRAFSDLRELVGDRPSALAADEVGFSPRELRTVPPFLPAQWLPARA